MKIYQDIYNHCVSSNIVANDYPDLIKMWKEVQENKLKYPETISEKIMMLNY